MATKREREVIGVSEAVMDLQVNLQNARRELGEAEDAFRLMQAKADRLLWTLRTDVQPQPLRAA